MNVNENLSRFVGMKFNIAATLVFISCTFAYSQVKAEAFELKIRSNNFRYQNLAQNSSNRNDLNFVPRAKDDKKTNGNRKSLGNYGGGNKCNSVIEHPVTALIPGKESGAFKLFTAQKRPTFWFYIPYSSKLNVEFILKDDKNNDVDRKSYLLPGEPGIINISLSKQAKPLETGKKYTWILRVKCNPEKGSADKVVKGYIERVKSNPNLTPTATTKPEQKAKLYAEDGLWLDSLTTVIQEMSSANPKQSTYINDLFQVYGLQNFAGKNIIPCCSQQK